MKAKYDLHSDSHDCLYFYRVYFRVRFSPEYHPQIIEISLFAPSKIKALHICKSLGYSSRDYDFLYCEVIDYTTFININFNSHVTAF